MLQVLVLSTQVLATDTQVQAVMMLSTHEKITRTHTGQSAQPSPLCTLQGRQQAFFAQWRNCGKNHSMITTTCEMHVDHSCQSQKAYRASSCASSARQRSISVIDAAVVDGLKASINAEGHTATDRCSSARACFPAGVSSNM